MESDIGLSKIFAGHQLVPAGNCLHTSAGKLPFKHIIHTVGPIYAEGGDLKIQQLRKAVSNSIELAAVYRTKTLAIPAISTGTLGFPKDLCARIFFEQVIAYAARKQMQADKGYLSVLPVKEVKFTNIDDESCEAMTKEFDLYDFSQGRLKK